MPVASHRNRDIGLPLTRSSLAVISDTTSPPPSSAAKPPKRRVGHARHGRQKNPVRDLNITYFQWFKAQGGETAHGFLVVSDGGSSAGIDCYAQILCSQVSCLHFRQFCKSCKCTATSRGIIPNREELLCLPRLSVIRAEPRDPSLGIPNLELTIAQTHDESAADCRHPRRRRTRPSRRRGRPEAVSLDRRPTRDLSRAGAIQFASSGVRRAAGA